MILKAVKPPLPILNRSHCPLLAARHHLKPLWQFCGLVAMTHPYSLLMADFLGPEQPTSPHDLNLHPPILLPLPNPNNSTQPLHKQLQPIANAKHEHAVRLHVVDEAVREARRVRRVNGVGAARQDDDTRLEVDNGFQRRCAGDAQREDR